MIEPGFASCLCGLRLALHRSDRRGFAVIRGGPRLARALELLPWRSPSSSSGVIATVTQELADQTGERRFDTFLVGSFALAALLLSAIGIYALLHFVVVQRTNEIGVRMALGATSASVTTMLLRQGLTLTLLGAVIGLIGAWSVSRLLSKLLYEVAPTDPTTFGISLLLLMMVAGLASWVPSRRAARIDPALALALRLD